MQLLEAQYGKPMDAILRQLYEEQELGVEDIAVELNLTKGTVSRWLARFGIQTRRRTSRKVAV
jgi:DNA-binding MarR family transcriptional regulator